ncbi:MAG: hypothetical protein AB1430_09230 [Pseudomonadota bacterium]
MRHLYPHRAQFVAAVAALDLPHSSEMAEYLNRKLMVSERRAQQAAENAKKYGKEVRAKVALALMAAELCDGSGRLLIDHIHRLSLDEAKAELLEWIDSREDGPAACGLRRRPDEELVEKVLKAARESSTAFRCAPAKEAQR